MVTDLVSNIYACPLIQEEGDGGPTTIFSGNVESGLPFLQQKQRDSRQTLRRVAETKKKETDNSEVTHKYY